MAEINGKTYCSSDDGIYQMPISIYTSCIIGPEGMCTNSMGITFDEYCNGSDPISIDYDRIDIFTVLWESMSTPLINSEGKINLKSDEFKAL